MLLDANALFLCWRRNFVVVGEEILTTDTLRPVIDNNSILAIN
jgi:hypothetical protein